MNTRKSSIDIDLNVFKFIMSYSIKCLFITTIISYVCIFIFVIFYLNYYIISQLYIEVNNNYVKHYLTEPMSNLNENTTKAIEMRLRSIEQVMMESKILNLQLLTKLTFEKNISFHKSYNGIFEYELKISDNSLIKNMTYFNDNLKFILDYTNNNYFVDIVPQEIVLFEKTSNTSIALYNDWEKNRPFLRNYIHDYYDHININSFNNFHDIIIDNQFSIEDYFNYVKFYSFTFKTYKEFNVTIGLRFDIKTTKIIYNKDNKNLTLLSVFDSKKIIDNKEIYFFPVSNYLRNFYINGMDINKIENEYLKDELSKIPTNRKESEIERYILTLENFYKLLNTEEKKNTVAFNLNLSNDFEVVGSLFNSILKNYYNHKFFYIYDKAYDDNKNNINEYNFKKCIKDEYVKLNISKLICKIYNFEENQTNKIEKLIFDSKYKDINILIENLIEDKFNNVRYYITSAFTSIDKVSKLLKNDKKKFLIYESKINNLKYVILELLNLEKYTDIELKFAESVKKYTDYIYYILILVCFIIFIVILILTISSVKILMSRINSLIKIRKYILMKNKSLDSKEFDNIDITEIEKLFDKTYQNAISVMEKYEYRRNDKFYHQLIIIIAEIKKRLIDFLKDEDKNIDYEMTKKMKNFESKFNIMCKYNFVEKTDYENAVKIMEEIYRLKILSFDKMDINLYYSNDIINKNLKVMYRLIDYMQDNNSHEKNLKFLKLEDIMKIICYIKRDLINPIISELD